MRDLVQQRDQDVQRGEGQGQQPGTGSGSGAGAGAEVQAVSGRLAEVEVALRGEVARLRSELGEALQVGKGGVGAKGRGSPHCSLGGVEAWGRWVELFAVAPQQLVVLGAGGCPRHSVRGSRGRGAAVRWDGGGAGGY